jgi:hypothetical protein
MQFGHLAYLAIEIARERTLEAEARHRYAEELRQGAGPGFARRSAARAVAGLSRASASIARRLDAASIDADGLDRPSIGA